MQTCIPSSIPCGLLHTPRSPVVVSRRLSRTAMRSDCSGSSPRDASSDRRKVLSRDQTTEVYNRCAKACFSSNDLVSVTKAHLQLVYRAGASIKDSSSVYGGKTNKLVSKLEGPQWQTITLLCRSCNRCSTPSCKLAIHEGIV